MTISYGRQVATASGLGVFWKLLFIWRGSIYKLVWTNLAVYIVLYYTLSLTYRFGLDHTGRDKFEQISLHCQKYADLIPVTFVLGFYVSIVITRWWAQYKVIPWPDSCCLFISTCIQGNDDRGRLMRRTIARYLICALIQTLRLTSIQVKKRFPTLTHLCDAGIITDNELKIIESLDEKCIQHPKYWMSLVWAGAIVTRAKKEGRIKDDFAFRTIIKEINKFRSGCGGLLDYDWISIPLVYTQVVTLAVYSFFLSSLMGRQFLDVEKGYTNHEVDLYVPVFTFLQFFFYMGWLKVAEVLINPFGEDDDDFEMNWLIDRNLQVSYLIVDEMHAEHPELVKDQFWDEGVPDELPYTLAAEEFRQADPWQGSTAEVEVSEEQSEFVYLERIDEEEVDDDQHNTDSDDDNLKEVKVIDENGKLTKPVSINNGKLKSVRESLASNLGNLSSRRNESSVSVMGMIRRVFTGTDSHNSRLNLAGAGSVLSVNSRAGSGAHLRTGSRVKKRRSRPGYHRSISNASPMSHESINQGLSRVNTHEHAIFKMSDTSSVGSLNTESDFPSRSNSEAKALREVRDILQNDLGLEQRRISTHDSDKELKSFRQLRNRRREESRRAGNSANVTMLKNKLEQVQALQAQIMKSLDAEMKHVENSSDGELDAEDAIQLLEQKTAELKQSYRRASARRLWSESGDNTGEMDTTWTCASSSPVPESVVSGLRRSRHPSFTLDTGAAGGGHGPVRGSVSLSSPGSPLARPDPDTSDMFAQKIKQFPPKNNPGSNGSFSNDVFDMESFREADDEDEGDDNEDGSNEEESEPQSVVENVVKVGDSGGEVKDDYYDESWDNLGTIEEQPELGYQSDSSDTADLVIGRSNDKKCSASDCLPLLPTVPEET